MSLRYAIGESNQALNINQRLSQLTGFGAVDGGIPSRGAGPAVVDFLDATAYIDGETVDLPATSVDLAEYVVDDRPRKVVIYIAPIEDDEGDAAGEYRVAAGEPAEPKPKDATQFDTYEPSPPDLSQIPAAPVAEVWLGAGAQQVRSEDIRDRRLTANIDAHGMEAAIAAVGSITDGAGVEHTDLASDIKDWDAAAIREAINTDPMHGLEAPHNYFSGSHEDLTDTAPDDHHPRYGDVEATSAIEQLDAAELAGTSATMPGQRLVIPDGENPEWMHPPRAVLRTGTITHTGGSPTRTTITNVGTSPRAAHAIGVWTTVESGPTWSASYGYGTTAVQRWDRKTETLAVDLEVEWQPDPGEGNDLEMRYYVFDAGAEPVAPLFDGGDVAAALEGLDLSMPELRISHHHRVPLDANPDPATGNLGDTAYASGSGSAEKGLYFHDSGSWVGPYRKGLTSISDLDIDVGKDWNRYRIREVGDPQDAGSAIRRFDIEEHANDESAHHTPLTGDELNHDDIPNVQPDQHHARPSANDLAGDVAGRLFEIPLITTRIPDTDGSRVHASIDGDETMHLVRVEVDNERGESPAGLTVDLVDRDTESRLYRASGAVETGSVDDPLASLSGSRNLLIKVQNNTGQEQVAGGSVSYYLEV